MISLEKFIEKYNGKSIDWDGHYGGQCMDLYRFYVNEVLGFPQSPAVPSAKDVWNNIDERYFTKVKNTPLGVPDPGDIMIWGTKWGPDGHIAVVTKANLLTFTVFEQNNPLKSPCHIGANHRYSSVIGWLKPKAQSVPQPTPPSQTSMTIHKILVLLNGVTDTQLPVLKQAVEHVKARVAALGDIRIEVDYLKIDRTFDTVSGPTTSGTGAWAMPEEIAEEGHKGELLLAKEFDLVTLVYDPKKVNGPPPTNPVENPVTIEGFNVNSIPTNWFYNPDTNYTDYDGARLFFYHEMLHSWYYIVNSEMNAGMPDHVHDFKWPEGVPGPTLEDQMKYFDGLALSLKNYWPALANVTAAPEERTCMLAFEYKGTVYVAIFAKFVPIGDQDTFVELGGNWNAVKHLTDAEFTSIVKPFLAQKTVIA